MKNTYVIRIAFPWQKWFRERASVLPHMYIASLVSFSQQLFHPDDFIFHSEGQAKMSSMIRRKKAET
jgi:hypothetical protein